VSLVENKYPNKIRFSRSVTIDIDL